MGSLPSTDRREALRQAIRMLKRDQWLDLARKLDWQFSYVSEEEAFPAATSGQPWLPGAAWRGWDEPFRTSYAEYVVNQQAKDASVHAIREAIGGFADRQQLDPAWSSAVKLHGATLALAEFAAVVGNLRAARFGRDSAWRTTAALGALDELRHTQIPLRMMHDWVEQDRQFDWTHKFFHTDQWVAIAARHFVDELLLCSNPIELAVATNFVFETGFTNLQFVGLAAMAQSAGDRGFEKLLQSIQTDEARHAQIGQAVLEILIQHDREYAQYLVDKWFWRTWLFFAIVTGFAMDYFTPVARRQGSFKEFVDEWILDQFQRALDEIGLERPWYWSQFLASTETYHHMAYASAYTYRTTLWFDPVLPGPADRAWLDRKYPRTWHEFDPIWERITERWCEAGPEVEWHTHGLTPVGFCALCQLVLCGGTPSSNSAQTHEHEGKRYIFCSLPCMWIWQREPARYAAHRDVVARILAGQAPANLIALVTRYFGLPPETWGQDAQRGRYPWLAGRRKGP